MNKELEQLLEKYELDNTLILIPHINQILIIYYLILIQKI